MAFDSETNSVVRSEDRKAGGAWGTARLKFDLVAIVADCGGIAFGLCVLHVRAVRRSTAVVTIGGCPVEK